METDLRASKLAKDAAIPEGLRGTKETQGLIRAAIGAGVQKNDIIALVQAQDMLSQIDLDSAIPASSAMSADERAQANADLRQGALKNIAWAIRQPTTSQLARVVLLSFATGRGPREFHFGPDSAGIKELFGYKPGDYFERETIESMRYMAYDNRSYATGDLRDGYQVSGYKFKNFTISGLTGFTDGIQLGDITGTFSSGLSAMVQGGSVYFHAENEMNLSSYNAGNVFPSRATWIDQPKSGPLSPVE